MSAFFFAPSDFLEMNSLFIIWFRVKSLNFSNILLELRVKFRVGTLLLYDLIQSQIIKPFNKTIPYYDQLHWSITLKGWFQMQVKQGNYTGCSAKMYPIFVLFISPVKIEIFQVCLFHIIGNFVFHRKKKFPEYLLNYECTIRSWMNRGKLCLYQGIIDMTLLFFFLFPVFQTRKPNSNNKTEN